MSENPESQSRLTPRKISTTVSRKMTIEPLRVTPITIQGMQKRRKYSQQDEVVACVPHKFDLSELQDLLGKTEGRFYDRSTAVSTNSS